MTTLSVGLVLFFAGRQHHDRDGDTEVFRYAPVLRFLFAGAFLLFLIAGFYPAKLNEPTGAGTGERIISWAISATFCALSLYGFLLTVRYRIVVAKSTIVVNGLLNSHSFTTTEVRSVEVHRGFRGARDLVVRDSSGHVLLKVGATIQDFDELLHLIRSRSPTNGGLGKHPR